MAIGFTSILAVVVIIQFICVIFLAAHGIKKKNPALVIIPVVSFAVFVSVVYLLLMKLITSM